MPKIISTTAQSTDYAIYNTSQPMNPIRISTITVNGRANVVQKGGVFMPYNDETIVSEEELEQLMKNPSFKRQVLGGYYKIVKDKEKTDSGDMKDKDKSAQLTEDSFNVNDDEETVITDENVNSKPKKGKAHKAKITKG